MKINKRPTVSNGIVASSFEIWTANLAQSLTLATLTNSRNFIFGDSNWKFCKVAYPVGTQKPHIEMQTFLTWEFIFEWKKSKPVGYYMTVPKGVQEKRTEVLENKVDRMWVSNAFFEWTHVKSSTSEGRRQHCSSFLRNFTFSVICDKMLNITHYNKPTSLCC